MRWAALVALCGCQAVFRIDPVGTPHDSATGSATDSAAVDATVGPRIVFVTKGTYAGDLTGRGGGDVLSSADSICQTEANTGMLPGAYRAWLSTVGTAAAGRMTHTGGPFMLPNGQQVATDWATFAFSTGAHTAPIDVDPMGNQLSPVDCDVWTNTNSDGSIAQTDVTRDCYDWSTVDQGAAAPLGSMAELDARFSASFVCAPLSCMASSRLYCVQQ